MPSIPLAVHPPAGSNETKEQLEMAGKVKALFDILSYPDGEIPVSLGSLMRLGLP